MQFLWDGILHHVITAVQMSLEGSVGLCVCVCVSNFLILSLRSSHFALSDHLYNPSLAFMFLDQCGEKLFLDISYNFS